MEPTTVTAICVSAESASRGYGNGEPVCFAVDYELEGAGFNGTLTIPWPQCFQIGDEFEVTISPAGGAVE